MPHIPPISTLFPFTTLFRSTINNDAFKLFKLNHHNPKNIKIIQINNIEVDHLIFDSKLKNSKKELTLVPLIN